MSDERPEDVVGGDAPDDDTVSLPALEPEQARAEPPRSRVSRSAVVVAACALLALAVTAAMLWQAGRQRASLAAALDEVRASLEPLRAASSATEDELARLQAALEADGRTLRALDDRLETLPGRFTDVERRIDALQGGSFDARSQWLESEAAYYLGVANAELQLGGRFGNALTALRLADARLRAIGDPALAGVREQIADEILALESVRRIDAEGLAHSLSRLSARVAELPLRTAGAADDPQSVPENTEEPGFGRLWSSVRNAFADIVTVERRDESVRAVLSAEEQRLIRRQLSIELLSARLALLSGEAAVFTASLEQAAALLREEFDAQSAEVAGAARLVESMRELDIAPSRPDISGSLNALRARGEP